MPRPKGSKYQSYRKIFDVLFVESTSYSKIIEKTELHRNTVSNALRYLVDNGLVIKTRKGKQQFYDMNWSRKVDLDWINHWSKLITKGDVYDRAMTTTLLNFQFNSKELIKNAIIGYALYELKQFNFEVVRNQLEVFTKRAYDTGISLTHKDWIQHIRSPYCPDCLQNRGILSPSRVNKEFQNYVDFVCVSCGLVFSFDQLCDEKVSYPLRLNPPSE